MRSTFTSWLPLLAAGAFVAALAIPACSGTPSNSDGGNTADSGNPGEDSGTSDAGNNPDSGTADSGTGQDSGSQDSGTDAGTDAGQDAGDFQSLAPCTDPNMYVSADSGTSIKVLAVGGSFRYSLPCLSIHADSTVKWAMNLAGHPLRPSTRGSSGNPIPVVDAGVGVTVLFTDAGFFPFYCVKHGDDLGNGMAGVIQVVP